jgi:hypothetical protein
MFATIQSSLNFMFYGDRRAAAPPPERRAALPPRERRSRVRNMARVYFDCHSRRALIRNLSRNGLMMETTLPPPKGQIVVVKIEGLAPIWGEVRWCKGGKAGIRFEEPISAEELFHCAMREPIANDDVSEGPAALYS